MIYVDARFTRAGKLEAVSDNACTKDNFVIRFNAQAKSPDAPQAVVLLSVDEPTSSGRPFLVTIEQADWMKRPSNVLAMSPCYPASGILTQATDGKGWTARVVQPPHGPDDL
ncbi:MAG TPA: hypothetical protein VHG72_03765 [Polyangia bacterium]|nr:hypothetical protein [Polyangia bacterium]